MILWDRCSLYTYRVSSGDTRLLILADIPCQVSALDSIRTMDLDAPWAIETTMRAILPAGLTVNGQPIKIKPSASGGHELDWRGVTWQITGDPSWRRKHGRDHHQTLELFRKDF